MWEEIPNNADDISTYNGIKEIIDSQGRDMYLRRRTDQKCRCFDPVTEESNINCSTCSGLGLVYKDKRVRAFRYVVSFPTSAAYRSFQAPWGLMGMDEVIFFIYDKTVHPSISDQMVEVVTDTEGNVNRPPLIERISEINQVDDKRDTFGQLQYWALKCRKASLGK